MLTDTRLGERLSEAELCPDDVVAGQLAAHARDADWLRARRGEFVRVPCPACDGDTCDEAFEQDSFQFVACRGCGTVYLNPRPSPEILQAFHARSENFEYWAKVTFPASEAARVRKLHEPRLARIRTLCETHSVSPGTLVEVGAGFGTFAGLAHERGLFERVVAVEPMADLADACRGRGVDVVAKPFEEVDRGDIDAADVVVAFEVIEHLGRPGDLVDRAAALLRPGGLLVLTCPNAEGFDIATLGPRSLAVGHHHMNLFTPRALARLVEASGFEVIELETPGRLDAEFVREAILDGRLDVSGQPFLKRVLIDEWDTLGWKFQEFLAANGLSSHLWLTARRR